MGGFQVPGANEPPARPDTRAGSGARLSMLAQVTNYEPLDRPCGARARRRR
jgi:hypothetical protein